jgi:hypothetical protein
VERLESRRVRVYVESSAGFLNLNISLLASYLEESMSIRIVEADLTLSKHREAVFAMVDRVLRAYEAAGFSRYSFQEDTGMSIFLTKPQH